jgi:hypothetical protein
MILTETFSQLNKTLNYNHQEISDSVNNLTPLLITLERSDSILSKLSIMQKDYQNLSSLITNSIPQLPSIAWMSSNFDSLATTPFLINQFESLKMILTEDSQSIDKKLQLISQHMENIHIPAFETILKLLDNIPPLNILNPYLIQIETLSSSLTYIENSLSSEKFFEWGKTNNFLTFEYFDSYNTRLETTLLSQHDEAILMMSNVLTKVVNLENFELTWSNWSNSLERKTQSSP